MFKFYCKLFALLCLLPLISWSQIGIHGDIHLPDDARLGLLTSSLHFVDGVVQSPNQSAQVILHSDLNWEGANHDSHLATRVELNDRSDFIFPVGNGALLHPLAIHSGTNASLQLQYNSSVAFEHDRTNTLKAIAPFHWVLDGSGSAEISLTWNAQSPISELVTELEALSLVGYTGTLWEEIPAQVSAVDLLQQQSTSLEVGSIRSLAALDLSQYSYLSLARKELITDLRISEAFSPNGDGVNEVWYIYNAERYPRMKIRVYNRWGAEVFSADNGYNNRWNGSHKDRTKVLPSASYFFQIDLEDDGEIDHQGWVFIHY